MLEIMYGSRHTGYAHAMGINLTIVVPALLIGNNECVPMNQWECCTIRLSVSSYCIVSTPMGSYQNGNLWLKKITESVTQILNLDSRVCFQPFIHRQMCKM